MQVKIQSEQDSLNYPVKLNGKLSALGDSILLADAAPTAQDAALYENLAGENDEQLAALKKVSDKELRNLNKAITEAGIPAVG